MQDPPTRVARADSYRPHIPITIITFDTLQSVSLLVLTSAFLIALLSLSVMRIRTWYCLIGSFMLYCVSFLLLAGHQTGEEPSVKLCILQAGMIHAAPALVAVSSLIFVAELYLRLTAVTLGREVNENIIFWMPWLLPIVHSIVFWVSLLIGLLDVKTIERHPSGLYCHIKHDVPPRVAGALVVLFTGTMVVLEVYTAIHLYRRRMLIKRLSHKIEFPLHAFVRMGIVTILGCLAIIMVFMITDGPSPGGGLLNVLTVLPFGAALLFGFQKDILLALMFWKNRRSELCTEINPMLPPA